MVLVSPSAEVPVVEGEVVTTIRELTNRGWGIKAIAAELGIARNTVRRYRRGAVAGVQVRRSARRLSADNRAAAQTLQVEAEGNAVVVKQLLAGRGCAVSVRTVQRAVAPVRQPRVGREPAEGSGIAATEGTCEACEAASLRASRLRLSTGRMRLARCPHDELRASWRRCSPPHRRVGPGFGFARRSARRQRWPRGLPRSPGRS